MVGLAIAGGICLTMLGIYSMCIVAGEADRAMMHDYIQAKKDRDGSASDSERDHD